MFRRSLKRKACVTQTSSFVKNMLFISQCCCYVWTRCFRSVWRETAPRRELCHLVTHVNQFSSWRWMQADTNWAEELKTSKLKSNSVKAFCKSVLLKMLNKVVQTWAKINKQRSTKWESSSAMLHECEWCLLTGTTHTRAPPEAGTHNEMKAYGDQNLVNLKNLSTFCADLLGQVCAVLPRPRSRPSCGRRLHVWIQLAVPGFSSRRVRAVTLNHLSLAFLRDGAPNRETSQL